jgi:hypothetical protein
MFATPAARLGDHVVAEIVARRRPRRLPLNSQITGHSQATPISERDNPLRPRSLLGGLSPAGHRGVSRSCHVSRHVEPQRHFRVRGTDRLAVLAKILAGTLLAEIRAMGYTGSPNLLARYLEQGRADQPFADPPIRRLTSWLMTDPEHLADDLRTHRDTLTGTCAEMTAVAGHVAAFAKLLAHHRTNDGTLAAPQTWIDAVTGDDLPALHSFTQGLQKDRTAVQAGLDLPYSNGATEGVNSTTKLLKRQTYGRAGFALFRQRILLN